METARRQTIYHGWYCISENKDSRRLVIDVNNQIVILVAVNYDSHVCTPEFSHDSTISETRSERC